MMLAQATIMGVEATAFAQTLAVLIGIWALYKKFGAVEESIAKKAAAIVREKAATKDEGKLPQPFIVKENQDPVTRGSYETHCRLNREEHAKIRKEFTEELSKLETAHHQLSREVSSLATATEINGNTLTNIDRKIDSLVLNTKNS